MRRSIASDTPAALVPLPEGDDYAGAVQRICIERSNGSTHLFTGVTLAKAEGGRFVDCCPESADNSAVDLTDEVTAPDGAKPSRERFPTWSPSGAEIAFWWHVTPQGFEDGEIYTMRADGTGITDDFCRASRNNPG